MKRVAFALLPMLDASLIGAQSLATPAAAAPGAPVIVPGVGATAQAVARELVAALDSPDSATRAAFLARTVDEKTLATRGAEFGQLLRRLHEQGGGFDIVKLEPVGRDTFLTVRSRAHPRLALVDLAWSRDDSTRLRDLEVLKAWNPAVDSIAWPATRLGEREVVATIARNVDRLARLGAFSGTVLVASGDRVIFERGYGWANLDDSVRNGPRTRYTTASMGKMFTAVAIAQLVEAGKLRLDDTLGHVLPDYPNAERARQITVRQLLGHTAGLGEIWSHPSYVRGKAYASNRELAWAIADAPLLFTPGTKWAYSNEGYIVLGAIVERLSGTSFEDYLRAHVWGPAGMRETGNAGTDVVVPHRAVGYRASDDDPLAIDPLHPNWPFLGNTSAASGAGGAYATAADYLRFVRALRAGTLVGAAMRDTLWTGRSPLPWDAATKYGYGFERSAAAGGRETIGHGGGGGGSGIDNALAAFVDGRYTIVVLGNIDPPGATDLTTALAKFLARQ